MDTGKYTLIGNILKIKASGAFAGFHGYETESEREIDFLSGDELLVAKPAMVKGLEFFRLFGRLKRIK